MAVSRQEEYDDQLFGYSVSDVCDSVKEGFRTEFRCNVDLLENALLEPQSSKEDKEAVKKAVNAIYQKCLEATKEPLEVLTRKLSGILSLPPHVLLPEDNVQRKRYTQEDEDNERAAIAQLESRLRRAQFMKNVYEDEIQKWQKVEDDLKLVDERFSVLRELEADTENHASSTEFHKLVQTVLEMEVEDASQKLTDYPCAESHISFKSAVFDAFKSS